MWCLMWVFIGAYYSYPNAEDLSLSVLPKEKYGFIWSIIVTMADFDGRYFTNVLHAINPLVFDWLNGYKIMPIVGVFFVFLSLFFFLKTLFSKYIKTYHLLFISAAIVLHSIIVSPSLPHFIYWMVSSFVYLYPWGLVFLWLTFLIKYYRTLNTKIANFWFLCASICLSAAIGMNEMFLPLNLFLLVGATWFFLKKDKFYQLLPFLLVGLASFYLFLSSPGINERASSFVEERNFEYYYKNFLLSLRHFGLALYLWIVSTPFSILLSMAICLSLPTKIRRILKQTPLFVILFLWIVLYSMIIPYYYGMGVYTYFPSRIYTSIVLGFFLIFNLSLIYGLELFREKVKSLNFFLKKTKSNIILVTISVICVSLFLFDNNILIIKNDYHAGILSAYKNEIELRYSIINDAKRDTTSFKIASIKPLKNKPKSIYYGPDIHPNRKKEYWNKAYEEYFNVDEVRFENDTTQYLIIKRMIQHK